MSFDLRYKQQRKEEQAMKPKAKIISCSLQKGGVGKTIFAVNIAAFLSTYRRSRYSRYRNRVLLVDIDTHSSATKYLGAYDDSRDSIFEVLMRKTSVKDAIQTFSYEFGRFGVCQIDLLPSNEILHHFEKQWSELSNPELRLKEALDKVAGDYEYIIIDCPPESDSLLTNAFNCTDYYILPVLPDANSFQELAPTISQIRNLPTSSNHGTILGCVINESSKRPIKVNDEVIDIKSLYSDILTVFDTSIPTSSFIDNSFAECIPIPFYHYSIHKCPRIFGAMRTLSKEVVARIDEKERVKYA